MGCLICCFLALGFGSKALLFSQKKYRNFTGFEWPEKNRECSRRDPYTLLYVGINTKEVIVIMEVIMSICGLIASIN